MSEKMEKEVKEKNSEYKKVHDRVEQEVEGWERKKEGFVGMLKVISNLKNEDPLLKVCFASFYPGFFCEI